MTDARARIDAARQQTKESQKWQHEKELSALIDEVEAEFGFNDMTTPDEPGELEADAKDIANAVRINGRTGGHAPQIKKAARYIDASAR